MASIFSYDPNPPRVASPWLQPVDIGTPDSTGDASQSSALSLPSGQLPVPSNASPLRNVLRLQAEPQEGPVEYKLHLLLRSRRKFKFTSTGSHISGSKHVKQSASTPDRRVSESAVDNFLSIDYVAPSPSLTQQTRQHRLEQLTTQLLWRLQQSSPHHSSSATNTILPSLPEALPELEAPQQPAKLLHGLEESQGALYEIGVSDDGTLVGLAEDEMSESLNNLRAMAACLGCTVEVLRKEIVGTCEWFDESASSGSVHQIRRTSPLIVSEAFVRPELQRNTPAPAITESTIDTSNTPMVQLTAGHTQSATEQLRISLTGPTMCGKSTLLGTLTTSTLDNGKGKSRLSMLKHRHEITSGITSSITQELMGYKDVDNGDLQVLNYSTEDIASWIDIHLAASESRLVFVSDSAGHPRYRRTTLRGLMGCAPHWTLLCIPAEGTNELRDTAKDEALMPSPTNTTLSDMSLSAAQLDLCLRLDMPLIIVITKLDLASRAGLRETLTKILDALKAVGKKPAILPNKTGTISEQDLLFISASLVESAYNVSVPLLNDPLGTVPIVLTSAVDGTGISSLHALIHEIPIPESLPVSNEKLLMAFHIEDVFSKPAEVDGVVVSGRLQAGSISVGDTAVVGPFASSDHYEESEDSDERPNVRPSAHLPASRSFPGAMRDLPLHPRRYNLPDQEWRRVKVNSIRNLRLPVHTLHADQVGTIAISLDPKSGVTDSTATSSANGLSRIRKGMVLAKVQPSATRTFIARFKREDLESLAVGNNVVVYIASVRASARIVSAQVPDSPTYARAEAANGSPNEITDDEPSHTPSQHGPFSLDMDDLDGEHTAADLSYFSNATAPPVAGVVTAPELLVTFKFVAAKEFIQRGDKVLIMPGGGPGLYGGHERGEKGIAGLQGFVGEIIDCRG